MMHKHFYFALLFVSILPFASRTTAEDPLASLAAIDSSVRKSLPYIEEKGNWWIEKKECMSCHRVAFTAWSHVEAIHAGVKADTKKVNDWIDWCNENLFEPFPEKDQKFPGEQTVERNLSGAAQMLALAKNWEPTKSQKEFHLKIIAMLKKGQMKDGKWNPKGQLPGQKRELLETSHVITLWNSLALANISEQDHVDTKAVEPMLVKAAGYVNGYDSGKSSEWIALRALFAKKRGEKATSQTYFAKLVSVQNKDGGWGWIAGDESDPLATGQILYALMEMEQSSSEAIVKKAVSYLLANQSANGVWKTKGTKKKAKNRFTETSNYWGTTWAVIGLSRVRSEASRN